MVHLAHIAMVQLYSQSAFSYPHFRYMNCFNLSFLFDLLHDSLPWLEWLKPHSLNLDPMGTSRFTPPPPPTPKARTVLWWVAFRILDLKMFPTTMAHPTTVGVSRWNHVELGGLSVAVQGVHSYKDTVVFKDPLILTIPVSGLHLS